MKPAHTHTPFAAIDVLKLRLSEGSFTGHIICARDYVRAEMA